MQQAFYKVSEKMYSQANPQGAQGAPGADFNGAQDNANANNDNVYEADYREVDDDNK